MLDHLYIKEPTCVIMFYRIHTFKYLYNLVNGCLENLQAVLIGNLIYIMLSNEANVLLAFFVHWRIYYSRFQLDMRFQLGMQNRSKCINIFESMCEILERYYTAASVDIFDKYHSLHLFLDNMTYLKSSVST